MDDHRNDYRFVFVQMLNNRKLRCSFLFSLETVVVPAPPLRTQEGSRAGGGGDDLRKQKIFHVSAKLTIEGVIFSEEIPPNFWP